MKSQNYWDTEEQQSNLPVYMELMQGNADVLIVLMGDALILCPVKTLSDTKNDSTILIWYQYGIYYTQNDSFK